MARGAGGDRCAQLFPEPHNLRTRGVRSPRISSLIAQIIASARSGEPGAQ